MQFKTKEENIKKMFILFEQNQRLITIKGTEYDILLENLTFPNIVGSENNIILSIRFNKNVDLYYLLQKMCEPKYKGLQISLYNEINIQISYVFDKKMININNLSNQIFLMEDLT